MKILDQNSYSREYSVGYNSALRKNGLLKPRKRGRPAKPWYWKPVSGKLGASLMGITAVLGFVLFMLVLGNHGYETPLYNWLATVSN